MFEAILVCVCIAAGFISAWIIGGKARELPAESRTRLGLAEQQLHEVQATLASTKGEEAIDSLVQPIRESLQKVDGKLGEMEKTRDSAYSALNEQLRGLWRRISPCSAAKHQL